MRLFRRRPDPEPLGDGVWRRAHDRFVRSVDRVHQALDGVPAGSVHEALAQVAGEVADLVPQVRGACARAQAVVPSEGLDVPGGHDGRYLDAHRELSRAATAVAQCSESLTMARVALGRAGDDPQRHVEAARRSAVTAAARVTRSCALIDDGPGSGHGP